MATGSPLAPAETGVLACPACRALLVRRDPVAPTGAGLALACAACGEAFLVELGVPLLYWPDGRGADDVAARVRAFYETSPFPDYDDLDSPASLADKARRGLFARRLDEELAHDARVLEAGCGTGQLTNFLALTWGREVWGADLSVASLRLAERFRAMHGIERAHFVQMNLFRPPFADSSFDAVISNGVLHHTADPARGLATIARLARPGGLVIVGLYNRVARATTHARRAVFRATGGRLQFLDPYLRRADVGARKKRSWFNDQYLNPHETAHTFGEALRWFDAAGVEFVAGVPALAAETPAGGRLFDPQPRGGLLDHVIVQLGMLLRGGREGGFFVIIGRRRT